jgi:hypothetical protein
MDTEAAAGRDHPDTIAARTSLAAAYRQGRQAEGRHHALPAGAGRSRADRRPRPPGHDHGPVRPGLRLPQRRAVAGGDRCLRAHAGRPGAGTGTGPRGHEVRTGRPWPRPTSGLGGSATPSTISSRRWPTASRCSGRVTWRP